jgi:hypothetical protein
MLVSDVCKRRKVPLYGNLCVEKSCIDLKMDAFFSWRKSNHFSIIHIQR